MRRILPAHTLPHSMSRPFTAARKADADISSSSLGPCVSAGSAGSGSKGSKGSRGAFGESREVYEGHWIIIHVGITIVVLSIPEGISV